MRVLKFFCFEVVDPHVPFLKCHVLAVSEGTGSYGILGPFSTTIRPG